MDDNNPKDSSRSWKISPGTTKEEKKVVTKIHNEFLCMTKTRRV
jgi:hypothetical protein